MISIEQNTGYFGTYSSKSLPFISNLKFVPRFSTMHFLALTFSTTYLFYLFSLTDAVSQLRLIPGLQCSYDFDLEVHTHRGKRSTKELNFKINAQVGYVPLS